jgi:hypothetical protein
MVGLSVNLPHGGSVKVPHGVHQLVIITFKLAKFLLK